MKNIILPELGDGIERATVAFWHAKEGDKVEKGDEIAEVVTDKATFNVEAECSGVLEKIKVAVGSEAEVGSVLGVIKE